MKIWAHGDTLPAADLNALSAGLNTARGLSGDAVLNVATSGAYGTGNVNFFIHTQRYLHFKSTGKLGNITNTEETGLSTGDSEFGVLDLDGVEWLAYGSLYTVTGCEMACEDSEP